MTDDTSRTALRALFDSALDPMLVIDDAARVVDANPAAAALRGEPRETLIGRWVGDLTPRDALDRGFERWYEFLEAGNGRDIGRLARADGGEREVEFTATANFMPGRHLCVLRDVTERNRAQREAQFQADLLDHVEAAVVAVDPRGRVTHWNAAAERLYGTPRSEAIGEPVQELVVAEGGEAAARDVAARVSGGGELERSRATLEAILGSSLDAIIAMDLEGRTIEWNPAAEKTFGYTRDEAMGQDLLGLVVAPALLARFRASLEEYRTTGNAWPLNERVEVTARRADDTEFPAELSVTDARIDEESPIFTAYVRDISERRQTHALLAERAEQQAAIAALGEHALAGGALAALMQEAVATIARTLDLSAVALLELCAEEGELLVRAAVAPQGWEGPSRYSLYGGTVETTIATSEPVVVADWATETRFEKHPAIDQLGIASLVDVVVGGGEHSGPWGALSATCSEPNRFSRHDVNFIQAVANVLAGAIERRRVEDSIRHRALHDDLTGLPNRALFVDRLAHALAQRHRRGDTVAVVFIDIDQFKVVNDSLGHQAGDRLLESVASRLAAGLRPGDTLARFAGDEFVVLCEGVENEQAAVGIAERLLSSFDEPFSLGNREHYVSASIGIALPRRAEQAAEDLIRDADTAMYRAKERGRARYELFDDRMRARILLRMRIDHDLRRAVLGKDLYVHYQPIVALAGGDVAGFEALMRWRHPGRGDIPPAEFIPVAEDSGLIGPMGRWILEQAVAQAVRWRGLAGAAAEPLSISVNLSVRQFGHGLANEVAEALAAAGLEPGRLLLEITESVLMDDAASIDELHTLKDLGVKLVLDDFGTGYSSLSYLDRFPIDALKIDRSFVAALETGGSAAIVEAIVSMAHALDLRVTAEGVESEHQIDHLRRIGCEFAQGWYFGRPAAPEAHDGLISSPLAG